jgi:hypothetical protein
LTTKVRRKVTITDNKRPVFLWKIKEKQTKQKVNVKMDERKHADRQHGVFLKALSNGFN